MSTASLGTEALAVAAVCILLWSLVSARLERWRISSAMFYVALGLIVTHGPVSLIDVHLNSHTLGSAAELALSMVLFTDASRVNLHRLRADVGIPSRLLFFGLPLAIVIGALVAVSVFGGVSGWIALLVAVIVAPTDAALGAPVIEDTRVPMRVRRALNVESGLNDGLATPIFTIVLALAVSHGAGHGPGPVSSILTVLGAIALGAVSGAVGGWAMRISTARGWSETAVHPISVTVLALATYGAALAVGVNGFVAAFVAGISFGASWRPVDAADADVTIALASDLGGILSALVWLMFGAMLVPAVEDLNWQTVVFAILALTLVRGLAVAVSLIGVGFDRATVRFIAWFGPRGLASVVFCLIAYEELDPGDARFVLTTTVTVVLFSVVAHGVSAGPLAERFGRSHSDRGDDTAPPIPARSIGRQRRVDT